MKTAVAYITDNLICPAEGVHGMEKQREAVSRYAKENHIEIVAWYEDELCTEDVLARPGVQDFLDRGHGCNVVIVDRVWSLSRNWSVLSRLFAEMDRRNLKLEAATTLWDGISQMARRHFEKDLSVPPAVKNRRAAAARRVQNTVVVRKPEDFPAKTTHRYEVL